MRGFSIIELLLVILIVAMLVILGVGVRDMMNKESVTLRLDEWKCVKTERRKVTAPMLVGKVTVMRPVEQTVCVEYHRTK